VGAVSSWCSTSTAGIPHGASAGAPCCSNVPDVLSSPSLYREGEEERKKQKGKYSVETHLPVTGNPCLSKWHEWYFVWLVLGVLEKDKRSG